MLLRLWRVCVSRAIWLTYAEMLFLMHDIGAIKIYITTLYIDKTVKWTNKRPTERKLTVPSGPMLNLATNEWIPTIQNHCEFFGNRNITQIQIKWKEINLNRIEEKRKKINTKQINKWFQSVKKSMNCGFDLKAFG